MKRCTKCKTEKPLGDFYKAKAWKDGRHPWCKDCFNSARRERHLANPQIARDRDRKRYANSPARQEAQKATSRARYQATHEEQLAYRRAYYEANRDRFATWTAKRKAIKRNVEHQPYTRREIYDRDDGHCKICGIELAYKPNGFAIDHIVPLDLRGPDTPANVQLTCQPCNRRKWANLVGQIHLPV